MAGQELDRAAGGARCPTVSEIESLFQGVVDMCAHRGLGTNDLQQGCSWLDWGGPTGEATLATLEQTWIGGHQIEWDVDKLAPPPPPPPPKHCSQACSPRDPGCQEPGVFYRFTPPNTPRAQGDYYYHVSNVYGGGSTGGYTGTHEWRSSSSSASLKKMNRCGQPMWTFSHIGTGTGGAYSEYSDAAVDCWSLVGASFETPPEVGWKCLTPSQDLCSMVQVRYGQRPDPNRLLIDTGVRLRSASFCIGDDMNATTSQCPGGDQDEALSDAAGAMDGWETCANGARSLELSTYGHCGGTTPLVTILDRYLAAAEDTAQVPLSMQDAGLDRFATFGQVCCETCPPPAPAGHGTFEPSAPPPPAPYEPYQQQHSAPMGMHASSCPNGGDYGGGRRFFAALTTFLSLTCTNVAIFLMASFAGCCCSRVLGARGTESSGRCSMCAALTIAFVLLAIIDFFGFLVLISPPPPEIVFFFCVLLASLSMIIMFNARHCSLQAAVQTVAAVVTTPVIDFQMATIASQPVAGAVSPGTVVVSPLSPAQPLSPATTYTPPAMPSPSVGVPASHASQPMDASMAMPSLGESLIPTTGFSLES